MITFPTPQEVVLFARAFPANAQSTRQAVESGAGRLDYRRFAAAAAPSGAVGEWGGDSVVMGGLGERGTWYARLSSVRAGWIESA